MKEALYTFTPYRSDDRMHAGLCCDKLDENHHMLGGRFVPWKKAPIVAGYEPGAIVDFDVQLDTNHNGFMILYLCDLDACRTDDLEWKCFKQGHCKKLNRVPVDMCQKGMTADPDMKNECGPIDPD